MAMKKAKNQSAELKKLTKTMDGVAEGFSWDNYQDEKTGKFYLVREALALKLSWVSEYLEGEIAKGNADAEEYADIIGDVAAIVDALPKTEKDLIG